MSNRSFWFWQCMGLSFEQILLLSLLSPVVIGLGFLVVWGINHTVEKRRWMKSSTYAMLKAKGYIK